jgi:hypothetical protein
MRCIGVPRAAPVGRGSVDGVRSWRLRQREKEGRPMSGRQYYGFAEDLFQSGRINFRFIRRMRAQL